MKFENLHSYFSSFFVFVGACACSRVCSSVPFPTGATAPTVVLQGPAPAAMPQPASLPGAPNVVN